MIKKELAKLLSPRKKDSHKGDYGHVFVLSGSTGLTGAAALCSQAALVSGAGLVTLGIPRSLNPIMEVKLTEVMTRPLPETEAGSLSLKAQDEILNFQEKCNCLIIGPGLSRNPQTARLARHILAKITNTVVLDADGINALEGDLNILKKKRADLVLTPHLGEFSRLISKSCEYVKKNRITLVKKFVLYYNVTLILKGYQTIVAQKNREIYINKTGNPGMATAGSGDVLTGIVGGFVAQGLEPFEAAKLAVYLHGLAGDLAAEEKTEYCLIASDILRKIPEAIKFISRHKR
jgi:NAD(P)H-hydrate epimerase